MCNSAHPKGKPFKRKPKYGYKIFTVEEGRHVSLIFGTQYRTDTDGFAVWGHKQLSETKYGFCFFPTKKEAERTLAILRELGFLKSNGVIRKIELRNPFWRHEENHLIKGETFDVGLCEEFKILSEEKP